MIRAALLACLLATPCLATIPTPANLELVGGYRLPDYYGQISPSANFSQGYFAMRSDSPGATVWHSASHYLLESSTTSAMGDAADPPADWPALSTGTLRSKNSIFGSQADEGWLGMAGMVYDAENDRLFIALSHGYYTVSDPECWLKAIDYPAGTVNSVTPDLSDIPMQHNGNGLTIVPSGFATTHLGGRRLAFAGGGYLSGQGASLGPCFSAISLTPSETPDPLRLMYWTETAAAGSDLEGTKDSVERIFPEYSNSVGEGNYVDWAQDPDGDPLVGYWGPSNTRGGAWVDVPGFSGMVYLVRQPTGQMDYELQSECFTIESEKATNLHCYTADQIATLAAGGVDPHSQKGAFSRWDKSEPGIPRGVYFDPVTDYLWVYYAQAIPTAGPEKNPYVAAYRFINMVGRPQRLTVSGSLTLEVAE